MKRPVVELSICILCEVCISVSPSVFRLNEAGYIEVIDHLAYLDLDVDEAIKNCPANCICWEDF